MGHSAWPAVVIRVSYEALSDGTRPQGTSRGWGAGPEHPQRGIAEGVRTEAATKAGATERRGRGQHPETGGHRAGGGRQQRARRQITPW